MLIEIESKCKNFEDQRNIEKSIFKRFIIFIFAVIIGAIFHVILMINGYSNFFFIMPIIVILGIIFLVLS